MKKLAFATAAVFAFAGAAHAVTLKNDGMKPVSVKVEMGGKKESVKIKPGDTFDSKGKDAIFFLGKQKPVSGKGSDRFVVKGGKIEAAKSDTSASAVPAAKTEAPAGETTGAK